MIGAIVARRKVISAFEALDRRDVPAHLRDYADDATYVFPGTVRVSGTFHGRKAIEAWFGGLLEQFPALKITLLSVAVEDMLTLGGTNTVAVEWEFSYTSRKGTQGTNRNMTVVRIRNGKVVHVRLYAFDLDEQKKAWDELVEPLTIR